jgi:hypothetical protein
MSDGLIPIAGSLCIFEDFTERDGVPWLQKREFVAIIELEGQGVEDAVAVIDAQSGRMIAFIGPDFPAGDRLASIDAGDMAELAALFDYVDAWFAPRLRGLIAGTVYAITHAWRTARDVRALLSKPPAEIVLDRHGRRFLALLAAAQMSLSKALDAFPVLRGRPADETRAFFLEELARIAVDNGMELQLPQDRDQREGGVTPFFTFVLAVIALVLERVEDDRADPAVRRRAAAFNWSRIALLHALERIKKKLPKSTG